MPAMFNVDYLILSAVPEEQEHLLAALENPEQVELSHLITTIGSLHGKRVCVGLTGIGTTNAAAVASALIHDVHPKAFFFVGSAGALRDDLKVGDVILGERAFEVDVQGLTEVFRDTPFFKGLINPYKGVIAPEIFEANSDLLQKAQSLEADFVTKADILASANCFPAPMHYFDILKQRDVAAIDMESSAIYQVSWLLDVPSLVIRSISNAVDDDGNEDTDDATLATASHNASKFIEQLIQSL
jgi:adenosylhomocysteine nucleosidase